MRKLELPPGGTVEAELHRVDDLPLVMAIDQLQILSEALVLENGSHCLVAAAAWPATLVGLHAVAVAVSAILAIAAPGRVGANLAAPSADRASPGVLAVRAFAVLAATYAILKAGAVVAITALGALTGGLDVGGSRLKVSLRDNLVAGQKVMGGLFEFFRLSLGLVVGLMRVFIILLEKKVSFLRLAHWCALSIVSALACVYRGSAAC